MRYFTFDKYITRLCSECSKNGKALRITYTISNPDLDGTVESVCYRMNISIIYLYYSEGDEHILHRCFLEMSNICVSQLFSNSYNVIKHIARTIVNPHSIVRY